MAKAEIPRDAQEKIARLLEERLRLEARALRELRRAARGLSAEARETIERSANPRAAWSILSHATALPRLQAIGSRFGVDLSHRAELASIAASELAVEQLPKLWSILGRATTGARVAPLTWDPLELARRTRVEITSRTSRVGVAAGEDVARLASITSYSLAREVSPPVGAVVGLDVATAIFERAAAAGERVIVTEATAGASITSRVLAAMKRGDGRELWLVWDSTLDSRRCPRCAKLHHAVTTPDKPFPGGVWDAPLHPNCRCAVHLLPADSVIATGDDDKSGRSANAPSLLPTAPSVSLDG